MAVAVASAQQAKQLKSIAQQDGGLQAAEVRILSLRSDGIGVKAIQRKTTYPQWFIDRVLLV